MATAFFAAGSVASVAAVLAAAAPASAAPTDTYVQFNATWIVAAIAVALVVQVVSAVVAGLIAANRAGAVFKVEIERHEQRLGDHGQRLDHLDTTVADARLDRAECEGRAGREYASRGELSRLVADNTGQYRDLVGQIDGLGSALHGRVTELAKQVAALGASIAKEPRP